MNMETRIKIWRLRLRVDPRLTAARFLVKTSMACFSLSKILWEFSTLIDAKVGELLDNTRAVLKER